MIGFIIIRNKPLKRCKDDIKTYFRGIRKGNVAR